MDFKEPMFIVWVELAMKFLADYDYSHMENAYYVLFVASFLFLFYAIKSSANNSDLLADLKLSEGSKKLKIKRTPTYIEIKGIKSNFLSKSYWRDNFEIFENIFNSKFIDVDINHHKYWPAIKLYFDLLPKVVSFDDCPRLKPMHVWLGKNQYNEDVVINLQQSPAIYVDGRPGSGKTVALLAMIESFVRSSDGIVDLTIVSTKPADFYFLQTRENINLKIIDPFEGDFSKQVLLIENAMSVISEGESNFKQIIKDSNIIDSELMNLEALRQSNGYIKINRQFFVFDEAKDYLSKNKADSKDDAQVKQRLVSSVYTHIRRTARFLSMPIIVASQSQNEGDLDIPLKIFHMRLASSTNEAMSRILCGDKRLTDLSFRAGKFLLKMDSKEHILKTPLL